MISKLDFIDPSQIKKEDIIELLNSKEFAEDDGLTNKIYGITQNHGFNEAVINSDTGEIDSFLKQGLNPSDDFLHQIDGDNSQKQFYSPIFFASELPDKPKNNQIFKKLLEVIPVESLTPNSQNIS